jgi:hypothetical protein
VRNHLHALAVAALLGGAALAACGDDAGLGADGGAAGHALDGAVGTDARADATALGCVVGQSPVTMSLCGDHPDLCGQVCGGACVDLANDADNCGACGVACKPRAACNAGVCGVEPTELVAPAPGCRSIRFVLDDGQITWLDLGHGSINRISTAGGAVTTLAAGALPAAIFTSGSQPLFANNEPTAAGIVVHAGTVYWIGASDSPVVDATGLAHGGGGTMILSVPAGGTPTTLLSPALAPGPSPVSSAAASTFGSPVESPDAKPPLSALALSPDAKTLYFGAGTRLYKMPAAGAVTADDVQLVGFTSGPEHGFATALAADDRRLYFPATVDDWVEIFDFTSACDGTTAGAGYGCPALVFGSDPIPLLDTVTLKDNFLYWAKEDNVWRADLSVADPSVDGHSFASDTLGAFSVTGFAVGPTTAYFGENTSVEKGPFAGVESAGPPRAHTIARAQTWPTSFAADGTNVYWTTSDCDIAFIADSPQ